MIIAMQWPSARVRCHALDIHHAKTMERNLASNAMHGVEVACSPMMPEGPYEMVFLSGTETTTTAELLLDQLQDLHEQLTLGGVCSFAYEGDTGPWQKQIRQIFGNISVAIDQRGFLCASARKTRSLENRRSFRAEFKASVPGMEAITLVSLPGVFCHRRPDMGGIALAEIAVKEQACIASPAPKILDMGCGCGLVGILLAKARPEATVTFVDSHSRAIEATTQNLAALGMKTHELVLSDSGVVTGGYDLFVGNPPYYSDFRIAGLFVETAFHALKPGGIGMLVAKSAPGLDTCIKTRFAETTVIPRRGYSVIRFVR
jgi:16S rRNA (guanine1207-N2)-methyltransferase